MTAIRSCPDHACFAGDRCPDCGALGTLVLSSSTRTRVSRFMSGALRHFPEDVGLSLDSAGWTPMAALVYRVTARYDGVDERAVAAVVRLDPKGRFERDGDRIRAAYGHSVPVELDAAETPVPDVLYHGTSPANREAILAEGLRPMGRQQVHLSGSAATAREVGRRHAADPVVFAVDAAGMRRVDHAITKRGADVYATDRVPPAFLSLLE